MKSYDKYAGMLGVGILVLTIVITTTTTELFFQTNIVQAQEEMGEEGMTGELTAAANEMPFGGDSIGTFNIMSDANQVDLTTQVDMSPSNGTVFEGWLVDTDTDFKLSLGQFEEGGGLAFSQRLVNPNIYNVLVITEEPIEDVDPNPATPAGGSELQTPFGE
jgi:hypothetical protein